MSARHRVVLALSKVDPSANYGYEVISTDRHATFIFEQSRSAEIVSQILRVIFKRKSLIHKGRKP